MDTEIHEELGPTQQPTAIDTMLGKISQISLSKSPSRIKKICVRVFETLRDIVIPFNRIQFNRNKLKFNIHMAEEHMSHGRFCGNQATVAIDGTLSFLKRMKKPNQQLIQALEFAKKIQVMVENSNSHTSLSKITEEVHKKIRTLRVDESTAMAVIASDSHTGHVMSLMITCTEDPPRKYRIELHNTGAGIDNHLRTPFPSEQYQTMKCYENVSEKDLLGTQQNFIEKILLLQMESDDTTDHKIATLYTSLHSLEGIPGTPVQKMWHPGQIGGSCSGMCLRSLVLSKLEPDEFKEFDTLAKTELLFKTWKRIKSGAGGSTTRKIALEVARDLASYGITEAKEVVRQLTRDSATTKSELYIPSANPIDDLQKALRLLQKGKSSEKEDQALLHFCIDSSERCTDANLEHVQKRQVIEVAKAVIALWEKGALSKTQIVAMKHVLYAAHKAISIKDPHGALEQKLSYIQEERPFSSGRLPSLFQNIPSMDKQLSEKLCRILAELNSDKDSPLSDTEINPR